MLYAYAFVGLSAIGGVTGLFLATLGTDIFLHDTYFVVVVLRGLRGGEHLARSRLGAFNTAVLIGSSLTMAFAVRSAQTNKRMGIVWWLIAAVFLGAVFLGVKVIEYKEKFDHHHVPGPSFVWADPAHEGGAADHAGAEPATATNIQPGMSPEQLQRTTQIFFSLYFTMTGLHALHMIVGIGIIAVIMWMAYRGNFDSRYTPVAMTGLYWHFVDIVWIYLFPLLYLVERHY